MAVRGARFAGSWYPAQPEALRARVGSAFGSWAFEAGASGTERVGTGALLPHAGLRYSARLIAGGLAASGADGDPVASVVVLAPSHYVPLATDRLHGCGFDALETPLGTLEGWPTPQGGPWCRADAAVAREHAVEMVLPFLAWRWPGARVALVLVPAIREVETVHRLAEAVEAFQSGLPGRSLLLASSDLTHYGPSFGHEPFGPLDDEVLRRILARDRAMLDRLAAGAVAEAFEARERLGPTMCGRYPALLLAARARASGWKGALLGQDDSRTITGGGGTDVVTYACLHHWEGPSHGTPG